ncbi:MAG: fused MFS/spermidine synthase [Candidatus Acidiferrum sp.]
MSTAPVFFLLVFDIVLFGFALVRSDRKDSRTETLLLSALFLCSGMPALIYQIVWQRVLFLIYGVNSQSVAVVVSAFMLGLGLGSLLGGRLSARFPNHGTFLFACAELGVAVFGLASLRIFHSFAAFTSGASLPAVIVYSLLLLLVPTILMGATLPLLVEQLVRTSGSVGNSVSRLYFVNTLGSAIACYLCATFLLRNYSQSGAVSLAAILNTVVGATAYLYARREGIESRLEVAREILTPVSTPVLSLGAAMLLAGFAGWISLGYEIAWFRVFAIASSDRAPAFALLLATYLAGIAAGSYVSEQITKNWPAHKTLWLIGALLCVSGAISVYLPPLVSSLLGGNWPAFFQPVWLGQNSYLASAPVFFLVAALLGSVLPLLCRLSISPDDLAGRRVSFVYASNILGSVLGSLGIGFVLMNLLGLRQVALLLGGISVCGGVLLLLFAGRTMPRAPVWVLAMAALCVIAIAFASPSYALLYERIIFRHKPESKTPFANVVENRNGMVAVLSNAAVFGGGVYDGHFLIDPEHDSNFIIRALAISAVLPHPRRILVIGLASGSWAQVIVNHPEAEFMDVVEINPGYLKLIPQYPVVRSLLTNPKVHVYVDDGRRWLIAHPERKYDLIVVNSTYHWRDHASTLLSVEFLRLVQPHLNAGGIYYFNTTESGETIATALSVFPFGLRISNFLAVSESAISFNTDLWLSVLRRYKIDGRNLFDPVDPASQQVLAGYALLPRTLDGPPSFMTLETSDSLRKRLGKPRQITDDNMGLEWEPNVEIPWH